MASLSYKDQHNGLTKKIKRLPFFIKTIYIKIFHFLYISVRKKQHLRSIKKKVKRLYFPLVIFFWRIYILTVFRPAWKKGLYTESYTEHVALCVRLSYWPSGRRGKTGFISFFFLQRWDKQRYYNQKLKKV